MTRSRLFALALLLSALVSLFIGALAIFVAFGCFLFWVTLPEQDRPERRTLLLGAWLALGLSGVGLSRFVATQAFFGISEAARLGTSKSVVSRLREIKFAESRAMELAVVDSNDNQKGSALFLPELSGTQSPRATHPLRAPLLDGKYLRQNDTPHGPAAALNGYLFFVCLPGRGGVQTADPSSPVDERAAETRFTVYAWPADEHQGHGQLFTIDASGRVLVHDNKNQKGKLSFVGHEGAPSCNLAETSASDFSPWRGKDSRPR